MTPKLVFVQDGAIVNSISFGIVPLGQDKSINILIKNVGDVGVIDLEFKPVHPDIKVVDQPYSIEVGEEKLVTFMYAPRVQLDEGVNTQINFNGKYVV
jgi:hypothetical protein